MTRYRKLITTLTLSAVTAFTGLGISSPASAHEGEDERGERHHGHRPVVHTADGPVRGVRTKGVSTFLGIPYAAPPVGQLRWRPPEPAAHHDLLDAVKYGNRCAQINTLGVFATPSFEEDCLFLNVFAPARASHHDRHPVMVWIHGGGHFDGASNDFDGSKLAKDGDTVVVTINYR